MLALIFCLTFPVIPILCALYTRRTFFKGEIEKRENSEQDIFSQARMTARELVIRYGIYTLAVQLLVGVVMLFLCDTGTSLLEKADSSPSFTLKFAAAEFAAAVIIAFAEWLFVTKKIQFRVMWQEYRDMGVCRFVRKYIVPCGLYLLAAGVVLLNVSLMFDNVLWGDECFSANTARKDLDGILQVMYFWENHPPLYYYWAKLFGEVLGYTGWVFHLASLTPFFIGVALALIFMRKRLGSIPAAFFIVITGVASSCIRYNLEIRMYSLAFLGVATCYYCAYRVISGGRLAWIGMVFWALVAAYSHYYAMMTCGILVFITGVAAIVRFRGKTWIKSLAALLAYVVGYSPWFPYLFHGTESVMNNWWMTEVMGLRESMRMILCGPEFEKIVLCMLAVTLAALFLAESSLFEVRKMGKAKDGNLAGGTNSRKTQEGKDKAQSGEGAALAVHSGHSGKEMPVMAQTESKGEQTTQIILHRPLLRGWSDQVYGAAIGVLTIVGTLIAAYLLCLVVGPVLTGRYLYPLSAVTVVLLVISCGEGLNLLRALGQRLKKAWPEALGKAMLLFGLLVLLVIGMGNYKTFHAEVMAEKMVTEQALDIIGEVPEDTALVSNHVKHLAWTVLYYYYPHRKVVTGRCSDEGAEYDRFWYFTPEAISKGELQEMKDMGYETEDYGTQQIATYPFELYYFERAAEP